MVNAMISKDFLNHAKEFLTALRRFKWERMDDGSIFFPEQKVFGGGVYEHFANDGLGWQQDSNLLPVQGLTYLLESAVGNDTAAITAWYVAIAGTATPLTTWTAANYASNATELTTAYSEATRVSLVLGSASGSSSVAIGNSASRAVFTAASASVTVGGAATLSSSTKGGTSGTLLSASKFTATRTLVEIGDTLTVGYTLTLTSS